MRPFQKVVYCGVETAEASGDILLASGHSIFTFRASSGELVSEWNVGDIPSGGSDRIEGHDIAEDPDLPPSKKRRLSGNDNTASDDSAEIVIEEGKIKKPHRKTKKDAPLSWVTNLRGSKNGQHVIVTTGEDKGLRVLDRSHDGKLHTLSERFLPKKAVSVAFTTDQQNLLCADKFGDVYAFPVGSTPVEDVKVESTSRPLNDAPYKPSANEFTVHTKKNREILRNQLTRSKQDSGNQKKKAIFEHEPVLGHVSMLTDVIHTAIKHDAGLRYYVLTSDRDEHIRVSRGPPQAHVIEGFCLGHTQFVSRLCIPEWAPKILISGGGDDYLCIWHWETGACINKLLLRDWLAPVLKDNSTIAVSGISALPGDNNGGAIIVSFEGVPCLFTLWVNEDGGVSNEQTVQVPSNVLDVAVIPNQRAFLWTVDNIHQAGSTKDCRESPHHTRIGMHCWDPSNGKWKEVSPSEPPLSGIGEWISHNLGNESLAVDDPAKCRELYYTIEHLRKQPTEEAE